MKGGTDDKGNKLPALISSFEDYSSDTRFKFIIKLTSGQMKNAETAGYHAYFSLIKTITYGKNISFLKYKNNHKTNR